jgi:hypothetical protein
MGRSWQWHQESLRTEIECAIGRKLQLQLATFGQKQWPMHGMNLLR